MADTASFKTEGDAGIKTEADPDSAPRFLDDADYEDTGDLEIPEHLRTAWLARLPQWLYKRWQDLDDAEEIQVGFIRHYTDTNHWKLFLDPSKHTTVPSVYNMERETDVNNTFIFSEKDMPGFKSNKKEDKKPGGIDKRGRFQRFHKSVPKQTSLRARVTTSINCHPDRKQLEAFAKKEAEKALTSNTGVAFLEGDPRQIEEQMNSGNRMIFDTTGRVTKKPRAQQAKATRMPENELRDALFDAFNEFKYWPMKALRTKLQQPEAYLKEVLASVADLVRTGPFTGTYQIKQEYETRVTGDVKAEAASEGEGSEAELSMKEEEDDVELSMNED